MAGGIGYRRGVALVVAAAVVWSLKALAIRLMGDAGTWQVLFWRSLGLVPVLFLVIFRRSDGKPLALVRATGWAGAIGGMGLVFAFAGAIFAIQAAPVANAVFLFAAAPLMTDRKSTRLNSSHVKISYAVFCLKKKRKLKLNKALTRT